MEEIKEFEIPYSLVTDEDEETERDIKTFLYPIDMEIVDKIVEELMDPLAFMIEDRDIIKKVDQQLYESLLAKAKEIESECNSPIYIYIPEAIHFIAYAKNIVEN